MVLIGLVDFIVYKVGFISFIHDYHNWRVDSLYTNPNAFGIMTSFCFLLLYYFDDIFEKRKNFILLIFLLGVIISGSRMALLVLLLGVIIKNISIRNIKYFTFIFLFIFIGLLFFIDMDILYEIFNKRLEIWSVAIDIFKNNFIFGIGTGLFQNNAEIISFLVLEQECFRIMPKLLLMKQ